MLRQGFTRMIALWATMSLLLASCSIYDEYPHRKQRDILLQVVDESGNVLPDSVAPDEVYAFVNGIYARKYTRETDGKIRLVIDDNDEVTLVAANSCQGNELTRMDPQPGDRISNVWLQFNDRAFGENLSPKALYYGSLSSVNFDTSEEGDVTITLRDVRAKARVYVKGLKARYGEGIYRVKLEGMNSGIAYDGMGCGRLINYEMGGEFNALGDWKTPAADVLPTTGEAVRLKIYKEDGGLLYESNVDEDGNPLAIKSGDDVVFYVSINQEADITIRVMPFENVGNSGFFQ